MGAEFTVDNLIEELNYTGAWKVTQWLSEKEVVRVTRKLYGGKISKRARDFVVTFARPNYAERQYGKRHPASDHLVKFPPKRKSRA